MKFRRYKTSLQELAVILLAASSIGLYLFTLSATWVEDASVDVSSTERIIRWRRNQTLPTWAKTMLSDQERIYFHETTGRDNLNLRQLCAVESAAKENPSRSIQIFFQGDSVNLNAPLDSVLKEYSNIAVILINASDYFAGTPLEGWYSRGEWRNSPYKTEHFSDYIRILSLHKGGGMYMDLDFVTLKTFNRKIFWNFVPEEDDGILTGSSFHFQYGHPIIRRMLTYLASSYHPKEWTYSGPAMIKHVVLKYCKKTSPKPTYPKPLCSGIKVLPKRYLYPYKYARWKKFFRSDIGQKDKAFQSYAVHIYNKLSKKEPVRVGSNQIYSLMARDHCPLTYGHAVDFF